MFIHQLNQLWLIISSFWSAFSYSFASKNTPPWALAGLPSHGGAGHLPSIGGPFEGEVGGIEGRGGTNCAPLSAQGPGCLSCQGGHPNPIFAWVTEQGWCYKYKNAHIITHIYIQYIYLKPDWPVYKWDDPPSRTFKIGFLDGRSWPAIQFLWDHWWPTPQISCKSSTTAISRWLTLSLLYQNQNLVVFYGA